MTGDAYLLLSSLKSGGLTMQFALRRNSCIKKNKSTVTGWCSGSGLCFAIEWSELQTHMTAWTTLLKCNCRQLTVMRDLLQAFINKIYKIRIVVQTQTQVLTRSIAIFCYVCKYLQCPLSV